MLAVKLLGIADILTALFIYNNFNLPIIVIPLFLVHFAKGVTSLGADPTGKIYGVVDIVSATIMMFNIHVPLLFGSILIIILLFKGATSLM